MAYVSASFILLWPTYCNMKANLCIILSSFRFFDTFSLFLYLASSLFLFNIFLHSPLSESWEIDLPTYPMVDASDFNIKQIHRISNGLIVSDFSWHLLPFTCRYFLKPEMPTTTSRLQDLQYG